MAETKLKSNQAMQDDGWVSANEAWMYASATTITVPSGAATRYKKGDKIKWTQTTVKYGVIVTVADTLLTIATNDTYTVANAAISANYYSHTENPIGFPTYFTYTVNCVSGFTATIAATWKFSIQSGVLIVHALDTGNGGTSNTNSIVIPTPVTPSANKYSIGPAYVRDNGASISTATHVEVSSGNANVTAWKSFYEGGFTTSGSKTLYDCHGFYFI